MSVITMSKELGSGGEEIARLVCDMLGYRYFDKQMIIDAARDTGLAHDQIVDYSEERYEVQNFLRRLFRPGPRPVTTVSVRQQDPSGKLILGAESINEAQYVALIRSAVQAAYASDDIVIIGRGGQAILQDVPNVLHVRIVAPMGTRIARLQQRQGGTAQEIEQQLTRQDRAAAEYIGRFFGVRWDDPTLYHLVLNTGKISLQGAAQIIVDALVQQRASIAG